MCNLVAQFAPKTLHGYYWVRTGFIDVCPWTRLKLTPKQAREMKGFELIRGRQWWWQSKNRPNYNTVGLRSTPYCTRVLRNQEATLILLFFIIIQREGTQLPLLLKYDQSESVLGTRAEPGLVHRACAVVLQSAGCLTGLCVTACQSLFKQNGNWYCDEEVQIVKFNPRNGAIWFVRFDFYAVRVCQLLKSSPKALRSSFLPASPSLQAKPQSACLIPSRTIYLVTFSLVTLFA